MANVRRSLIPTIPSMLGVLALTAACSGCFMYSAPRDVHDALERDLGTGLERELGLKLGPLSTRIAASFVHDTGDDDDFLRGISSVRLMVYERGAKNGHDPQPIRPEHLGVAGWSKVVDTHDGEDQVLVFAKPDEGEIREMVVVAVDDDEVTVARLRGHLTAAIAASFAHDHASGAKASR